MSERRFAYKRQNKIYNRFIKVVIKKNFLSELPNKITTLFISFHLKSSNVILGHKHCYTWKGGKVYVRLIVIRCIIITVNI